MREQLLLSTDFLLAVLRKPKTNNCVMKGNKEKTYCDT